MAEGQPITNDVVPQRHRNLVVFGLMIGMLLAMLDNTIVGTAMPTIVAQLGGLKYLSWVVTAYSLATAASTPLWGKFGDMYGRKGVFLAAVGTFLAGSTLSGVSVTMGELIGFRALQGLGAGGLMVGAYAIMGSVIPTRERGKYQGMMSVVMGGAMVGGPLLGGFLTDHGGWRWDFFVNLPLGGAALVVIITMLRLPKRRSRVRVDYPGAAALTVAITAVVLVTSWGGTTYAWDSPLILGLIALAVLSALAFSVAEGRAAEPVLPFRIFRNANFSLITVVGFVTGLALFGVVTFLPVYQQLVKGASATNSGVLLLPVLVAMTAVNIVAGRIITATGRYKGFLLLGGVLMIAGMVWLGLMDTGTGRPAMVAAMALTGAGLGFLMQISMLITLDSVEMKDRGVASSTATLSRTIGGSLGVSVMGALFSHRVAETMAHHGGAAAQGLTHLDPAQEKTLPAAVRALYEHAVAGGTQQVFLLAAGASVVALAACWFVREVPLRGTAPKPRPNQPAQANATSERA